MHSSSFPSRVILRNKMDDGWERRHTTRYPSSRNRPTSTSHRPARVCRSPRDYRPPPIPPSSPVPRFPRNHRLPPDINSAIRQPVIPSTQPSASKPAELSIFSRRGDDHGANGNAGQRKGYRGRRTMGHNGWDGPASGPRRSASNSGSSMMDRATRSPSLDHASSQMRAAREAVAKNNRRGMMALMSVNPQMIGDSTYWPPCVVPGLSSSHNVPQSNSFHSSQQSAEPLNRRAVTTRVPDSQPIREHGAQPYQWSSWPSNPVTSTPGHPTNTLSMALSSSRSSRTANNTETPGISPPSFDEAIARRCTSRALRNETNNSVFDDDLNQNLESPLNSSVLNSSFVPTPDRDSDSEAEPHSPQQFSNIAYSPYPQEPAMNAPESQRHSQASSCTLRNETPDREEWEVVTNVSLSPGASTTSKKRSQSSPIVSSSPEHFSVEIEDSPSPKRIRSSMPGEWVDNIPESSDSSPVIVRSRQIGTMKNRSPTNAVSHSTGKVSLNEFRELPQLPEQPLSAILQARLERSRSGIPRKVENPLEQSPGAGMTDTRFQSAFQTAFDNWMSTHGRDIVQAAVEKAVQKQMAEKRKQEGLESTRYELCIVDGQIVMVEEAAKGESQEPVKVEKRYEDVAVIEDSQGYTDDDEL